MPKKRIHIPNETPVQRKARYRENKRTKETRERAARRREVAENRTVNRRLSFLSSIIRASGLTLTQVSRMCGMSQQSISWIFSVVDDCALSKAEKILDAIGIRLSVMIKRDGRVPVILAGRESGINDGVKFRIEGNLASAVRLTSPKMPAYVNSCIPEDRMYFLATYLPTCGMRITDLMTACDIDMSSLRYIFDHDDIKISQIFDIARATGGVIIWKID